MFTIQVIFRVFDRDQAPYEFKSEEILMVYNIKQRVKMLTGNDKRQRDGKQSGDTTIFKEIVIDNGKRMIIYKWLKESETRNRTRRYGEELFRTSQTI